MSIPIARSYDDEGYIRKAKVAAIVHNKDGDDTIVNFQVKQSHLLEELEQNVDSMVFSALKVGKFTVLVKVEVSSDKYGEVMYHLTEIEKVDAVIRNILDKEGCDGYEAAHLH
ncbi:hypothetical protein E8E11_007277 [Didymella keratinophila]|nr:hypothetical protein E8E11_007277 [Didymella keratinophila]